MKRLAPILALGLALSSCEKDAVEKPKAETLDQFRAVLAKGNYRNPSSAIEWMCNYRRAKINDAACNNFAEYSALWASEHGYSPYIVTFYPSDPAKRFTESWHQITVCKTPEGYLIFDNETATVQERLPVPPGMEIIPIGGCIPWSKGPKLLQHLQPNSEL